MSVFGQVPPELQTIPKIWVFLKLYVNLNHLGTSQVSKRMNVDWQVLQTQQSHFIDVSFQAPDSLICSIIMYRVRY